LVSISLIKVTGYRESVRGAAFFPSSRIIECK
jgi:hypothetical protein